MDGRSCVVMKFGGSSVADPAKIARVAERLVAARETGLEVVGTVSAMGSTTDTLLELAHEVSAQPNVRELDMLLSTGERIACALVAMAVHDLGQEAVSLTGSQAGIITDAAYTRAKIREIRADRVRAALDDGKIVLVAGFQGYSQDTRDVTTLGRGGTDATAVALAAALGAACEIYSDVAGVYTADPRIVPGARRIPVILSSEMAEMSWRGAKAMHPRAVELGALHGVEIHVKSSFLEGPGTIITGGDGLEHLETRETVAGIVHDLDVSRITLTGIKTGPGTMSRVFSPLAEAGISVDVIVESAPKRGASDVAFTVRRGDFSEALRLAGAVAESLDGRVEGEEELGKVSVVGTGMLNRPGYAARMFATLGEAGIPIRLVSTSEIQVTCVLPAGRVEEAVRVLHRDFELEERDV